MPRLAGLLPDRLVPAAGEEEAAYRAYVRQVVERYDGDGRDADPTDVGDAIELYNRYWEMLKVGR